MLTAHVGNWQVAMTALREFGRTVHIMMRPEDNVAVKEALNIDSEKETIRIIYTDGAMGGVIEALKAINQGDIVSIMGDRTYGYASVEASLLGGNVRFPYGVFSLAVGSTVSRGGAAVGEGRSNKTRYRCFACDRSSRGQAGQQGRGDPGLCPGVRPHPGRVCCSLPLPVVRVSRHVAGK